MKALWEIWSSNAKRCNSSSILSTDRFLRPAWVPFVLRFLLLSLFRSNWNISREAPHLNEAGTSLWPFVVYAIAVLVLVATMLGLSFVLGQRRSNKATNMPFESGVLSVGTPQMHMSAEFYLIAIFFVIFDLETVFIFAWAVAFFELGWSGFVAISAFIFVLGVALVYELRSGALDWGIKSRTGLSHKEKN
jgi:NADH-quinone oxidoreductase subunit A